MLLPYSSVRSICYSVAFIQNLNDVLFEYTYRYIYVKLISVRSFLADHIVIIIDRSTHPDLIDKSTHPDLLDRSTPPDLLERATHPDRGIYSCQSNSSLFFNLYKK